MKERSVISLKTKQECLWMFKQGLGYKRISKIMNLKEYTVRDYGRMYHSGDLSFANNKAVKPKDKNILLLVNASLKYFTKPIGEICSLLNIEREDLMLNFKRHEREKQNRERRIIENSPSRRDTKVFNSGTGIEIRKLYTQESNKRDATRTYSRENKRRDSQKKRIKKIDELVELGLSIKAACRACKLSRSMYYRKRKQSNKEKRDALLSSLISLIQTEGRVNFTYGVERITHMVNKRINSLSNEDKSLLLLNGQSRINHKRIHRLMKENNLSAHIKRRNHPKGYYVNKNIREENRTENILDRKFFNLESKKLVTDVTYLPCKDSGFIYLSPLMDLANEEIISFSISYSNSSDLVTSMFDNLDKDIIKGALMHTDQGSVYTSEKWINLCSSFSLNRSMSRRGNCWDNAVIESFFSRLKSDLRISKSEKKVLYDSKTLIDIVSDYIYWYNNFRIQKRLNFLSPVDFRKSFLTPNIPFP